MDKGGVPDLSMEVPMEEELLAACEAALEWFEEQAKHAPVECAFGGEYRVIQKLCRAVAKVRFWEEL